VPVGTIIMGELLAISSHTVSHTKMSSAVIPFITEVGEVYFAQFIFRVSCTQISQRLGIIDGKTTKPAAQSYLAKAVVAAAALAPRQAVANNAAASAPGDTEAGEDDLNGGEPHSDSHTAGQIRPRIGGRGGGGGCCGAPGQGRRARPGWGRSS